MNNEWNDAVPKPKEAKLYETQGEAWDFSYQYFNGLWYGLACVDKDDAIKRQNDREFYKTTKWREVQS